MTDKIIIKGARVHNLKNISLEIPKDKLVVFTGISGSGKSSLAFDTIYAEGQRRYVESLSSYARQFLGVMDKPDVDSITGLSPAISVDQKSVSHNPRSTVGTITEIYDYLRLLFARIGHPHCPGCGREVARQSIQQIVDRAYKLIADLLQNSFKKQARIMILSPLVRDRKGIFSALFDNLRSKGFKEIRVDGQIFSLSDELFLIKTNKHVIDAVVDKLSVDKHQFSAKKKELITRITESIEKAVVLSQGLVFVSQVDDPGFSFPQNPKKIKDHLFSERLACPWCNISLAEIEPRLLSFNSPHGACPVCDGIGKLLKVDASLIINKNLSITEGGIIPFAKLILADTWYSRILSTVAGKLGIDIRRPIKEIPAKGLHSLFYGTGDTIYEITGENRHGKIVSIYETFKGIINDLEKRYRETDSDFVRYEIGKYLKNEICPKCQGKRLQPEALAITINNKNIVDITNLSIKNSSYWIAGLPTTLPEREKQIADLIIKELNSRLSFLLSVGLEYLSLDREAGSLAGGESQRIRLASQLGTGLSGVLYVLDEPSIGLHQKDNLKLITTLKNLRDLGNTVVVVEHDREMIEHADYIFDFGPQAGDYGGRIVAEGSLSQLKTNRNSLTAKYLTGEKNVSRDTRLFIDNNSANDFLTIYNCRQNNLKNINVKFPLNHFVCVTGVSGSGKSTLVVDTLYKALEQHFNPYFREKSGKFDRIDGLEQISRVVLIDQSPIGRTPRSNPATYTGAFTFIRDIFSLIPEAKARGYKAGRFSFNVKGGRCEVCEGDGETKIEMQFLPDVYVTCDVCKGERYNAETLEIRFKEKNISEILKMTVGSALEFFAHIPGLYNKLETLNAVGLSYIKLGQPATHLSGGEAQRVKLATELSKKAKNHTVFILDEPTTGLHFADLAHLLKVLHKLVEMGNTVIIIEHNLDIIKNADWTIDLGPEGGDLGGRIVAQGDPKAVAKIKDSYTGKYLGKFFR